MEVLGFIYMDFWQSNYPLLEVLKETFLEQSSCNWVLQVQLRNQVMDKHLAGFQTMSSLFIMGRMYILTGFSPFSFIRLPRSFHPPHIYNSLKDCSPTAGCQIIQTRHHRWLFSSTLLGSIFTVHSPRLTEHGRLLGRKNWFETNAVKIPGRHWDKTTNFVMSK